MKNDVVERYQSFLNEVVETINAGEGNLLRLGSVRRKYGIDSHVIPFIKHKGIITQTNGSHRYPLYTTSVKTSYSINEVAMFMAEMGSWKRDQKKTNDFVHPKSEQKTSPKKGSSLTEVSSAELIKELKRRGYSGTLQIQKNIVF